MKYLLPLVLVCASCASMLEPADPADPTGPTQGDVIVHKTQEVAEDVGGPVGVAIAMLLGVGWAAYKGKKKVA